METNAQAQGKLQRVFGLLEAAYKPRRWHEGDHYGPLDELILTILSQHTSDQNSIRAFGGLKAHFSDWQAVADAPIAEVVEAIRSGGLAVQKAPRIQGVLREIAAERGNFDLSFLADLSVAEGKVYLTRLKGVGPKTAACVLLFALGKPALPVDTHIFRISRRLGLIGPKLTEAQAHDALEVMLEPEQVYSFHINMITHGRKVCRAQNPLCAVCPLQAECDYYRTLAPSLPPTATRMAENTRSSNTVHGNQLAEHPEELELNLLNDNTLRDFSVRFISIVVTALPLLVLGVFVFAILEQYVPNAARWLPRRQSLAIPLASLAGAIVPVCDCGAVPVAHGMVRRGVGLAPAMAFVVAAPVVNPIVFVITATFFGWQVAAGRLLAVFIISIIVGAIFAVVYQQADARASLVPHAAGELRDASRAQSDEADHYAAALAPDLGGTSGGGAGVMVAKPGSVNLLSHVSHIISHASTELVDLGRFLILGAFVAALITTFVPQDQLRQFGSNPITSVLVMMLLAVILSLCSLSDAAIATSFVATFSPGAVFAFLLYGQMVDLKNLFMMLAAFNKAVVALFVLTTTLLAFSVGVLINGVLR